MKNSYIKLTFALSLSIIFGGCSDFLDPKAKSEFVPKDAESLNELLLGEAYPTTNKSYLEGIINMLDDDVDSAPYQIPATGFTTPDVTYGPFTWQGDMWELMNAANANKVNMYSTHYQRILGCNAILDYIDDVTDTEEAINYVLAQAYALRGFYYLQLVNIFGQPYQMGPESMGVPLKKNSGIENKTLARSTVGEVYDFIFENLLEAERIYLTLPEDKQWSATFRTNLPMVQLLLSRAYLYTENWEKAAEYAQKVMNHKQFRYLDLNEIPTHKSNQPTVRVYTQYHSYENSPEAIWVYGNVADACYLLTQYSTAQDGHYIHSCFKASDDLMSTFDATPGDLRKDRYVVRSWFTTEETDEDGNVKNVPMPQAIGKVAVNSYFVAVYGSSYFSRSLRLSEACLNYAEAKAMLGSDGEAISALNEMRKYRFSPDDYVELTPADCTDGVLQFIRDERRRELCFETHRWFDLRRWGMPEIKHTVYTDETTAVVFTLKENDPLYTVPIPDTSLELNSELRQIPLGEIPRNGEVAGE